MDFSLKLATAVLARTPDALSALLSGLGEEWTAANEGRDTWSPFKFWDNLTHVEESDWMDRTTTILASSEPTAFEPIDRGAGFARFGGLVDHRSLEHFKVIRTLNLEQLEAPRVGQ